GIVSRSTRHAITYFEQGRDNLNRLMSKRATQAQVTGRSSWNEMMGPYVANYLRNAPAKPTRSSARSRASFKDAPIEETIVPNSSAVRAATRRWGRPQLRRR